jgi:hypothetical protein
MKVLKVFRHEINKGEVNIGVLFANGSFELLKYRAEHNIWQREPFKGHMKGKI